MARLRPGGVDGSTRPGVTCLPDAFIDASKGRFPAEWLDTRWFPSPVQSTQELGPGAETMKRNGDMAESGKAPRSAAEIRTRRQRVCPTKRDNSGPNERSVVQPCIRRPYVQKLSLKVVTDI